MFLLWAFLSNSRVERKMQILSLVAPFLNEQDSVTKFAQFTKAMACGHQGTLQSRAGGGPRR